MAMPTAAARRGGRAPGSPSSTSPCPSCAGPSPRPCPCAYSRSRPRCRRPRSPPPPPAAATTSPDRPGLRGYHSHMRFKGARDGASRWVLPFTAGVLTAGAGLALLTALGGRRRVLDPRLIRRSLVDESNIPPAVIVPGIMGSGLLRPDATRVWLNLRNAV